jgi:hypothetical protein
MMTTAWHGGRSWSAELGAKVLTSVPYRTSQDATQDVSPTVVQWHGAVGDCERQGAHVISNDSVCHVDELRILRSDLAGVWPRARDRAYRVEEWNEDVGVLIGVEALQYGRQLLEAHAGIDVLRGQRTEGSVGFAIELYEHVIPYLDDVWTVGVHEGCGITAAYAIVVDFLEEGREGGGDDDSMDESVIKCSLRDE